MTNTATTPTSQSATLMVTGTSGSLTAVQQLDDQNQLKTIRAKARFGASPGPLTNPEPDHGLKMEIPSGKGISKK